jgi:hypothetical protein
VQRHFIFVESKVNVLYAALQQFVDVRAAETAQLTTVHVTVVDNCVKHLTTTPCGFLQLKGLFTASWMKTV